MNLFKTQNQIYNENNNNENKNIKIITSGSKLNFENELNELHNKGYIIKNANMSATNNFSEPFVYFALLEKKEQD